MTAQIEPTVLIAVASKEGKIVNQHFGHAERFLIYQKGVNNKIAFHSERRVTEQYCLGEDTYSHPFEEDRFMNVANTIKDCSYLICSMIGTVPEQRLKKMGITTVKAYELIDDAMGKLSCICQTKEIDITDNLS